MPKKYVPEGAYLACNKGTSPCTLRVSNNQRTTIYNVPMASELDFIPFFNIKPMGFCTCPAKIAASGVSCIPGVVTPWQNPKDGIKINGSRLILEDSHNNCIFGGEIKIFFDRPSAVAFGVGEGKMPTEYIKEGFDWLEEKVNDGRKVRDEFLPDWMKPVTGLADWYVDMGTGLVEGAVNGVVGLGETIYQVAQDPVGTTEALVGMAVKADKWVKQKEAEAIIWASKGENWENAANGAWDWASDGENWKKAGETAVKGTKDAADWVTKNPRKIGNTVGEFIPDAVAAVYSGGASTALSAGKVAVKEVAEVAVEKAVKETIEEGVEKAGKEALEAGVKKAGKELIESLADNAGDIAKVVTKSLDDKVDDAIKAFDPAKATNAQKGNFGEMITDKDMIKNGYETLHPRLDDINAATKQGIDGVFKHPGPPPKYIVVDAKYGKAGLGTLEDGTRQMSDKWIQDRLGGTVSRSEARNISKSGYERVVSKVDSKGNITYRKVDKDGYVIRGKKGNWP